MNQPPLIDIPDPIEPRYSSDEWYTPLSYIAAARRVLGVIDLDPASCAEANVIIKARHYYTKEDDGLNRSWANIDGTPARVWCNPPYSAPLIQEFTKKLLEEYDAGRIAAALYLVNNCTDTGWFHSLMRRFPLMFSTGRVAFWGQPGPGARQGQAIFYLGNEHTRFYKEFQHLAYAPNYCPHCAEKPHQLELSQQRFV